MFRGVTFVVSSIVCCSGAVAQLAPRPVADLSAAEAAGIEKGLVPRVILAEDAGKTYDLHERMVLFGVPGVSAAVFDDHHVIWAKGYGSADSRRLRPVDVHTRFQAASISKPVTAFAVMTLVQSKGLDIDRDVNDYLRTWKVPENDLTRSEKVTIRRLLSHTAGLNVGGFAGYEKTRTIPSADDVLNGKGNSPALRVVTVPGSKYSYSGGGYVVLQKLIEDQSGMPFGRYLQLHVLAPLHMTDSTFDPDPEGNVSRAHQFDGQPYPGGWHVYPELAPAGLWTTPSDVAKFCFGVLKALSGTRGALISQSLAGEMIRPSGKPEGGNGYGLGFELRGTGATASFGHGGSNAGFKSELFYFPQRRIGVILMTNSENGRVVRNELARSISNKFGLGLFPTRSVTRLPVSAGELAAIVGRYRYPGAENYFFSATSGAGNELVLKDLTTGKTNHLIAFDRDKFIDRYTGEEVAVTRETATGEITGLRDNDGDALLRVKG